MTALLIMTHMIYDFSIAGIHLRCDVPFEMYMSEETEAFVLPSDSGQPAFFFHFLEVGQIDPPDALDVRFQDCVFVDSDTCRQIYRYQSFSENPVSRVTWRAETPDALICEYTSRGRGIVYTSRDMINLLSLELFLLHFSGLLLHCSFIRSGSSGILFTAPSGTGKSTQADLWKTIEHAEVINGDRAALLQRDGSWTAWGLPYAGTSGIYRNLSASVDAIVVLRQAPNNFVRLLNAAEALRFVYPELTLHRWDAWFVDRALALLLKLLEQVPVYLLECTPDSRAVHALKSELLKGGIRV